MSTIYHMVHYRLFKADAKKLNGKTLEILCREALNTEKDGLLLWARPEDRIFDVGDEEGRKIFLNKVADLSSAVFGEICLAQAHDLQALLQMKPSEIRLSDLTTATVYDLNEREAPKDTQFVRGLAYWLAIGNHVFFVKTHSMTPEFIRLYVDWLIKTRASVADPDLDFVFDAEIDKTKAAGDIGDIRTLRVSGKTARRMVVSLPDAAPEHEVKTSRTVAGKFAEMQQAVPIIEALFGKSKAVSLIESLGPKEYLSVDASVKVRGRRTEKARAEFRRIATDIADASDAKVEIEGKDGKISAGDAILRTKMPFHQPHEGSSLLEFDNVADQLQEVYSRFLKDGKIIA